MRIPSPIFPREHGGWAVVITPMVADFVGLWRVTWDAVVLVLAVMFAYLSYDPLSRLFRRVDRDGSSAAKLSRTRIWASVYLVLAAIPFLALLLNGYTLLLLFGGAGACLFAVNFVLIQTAPNSVFRDLSGIAGLSLTCPSLYYVLCGTLDRASVMLWLFIFLFFVGTTVYVHMRIGTLRLKKVGLKLNERLYLGRWTIGSFGVMFGAVIFLSAKSYVSSLVIISFLPMTLHAIMGILKLESKVNFRNLGFLLLGQSLLFGILAGTFL